MSGLRGVAFAAVAVLTVLTLSGCLGEEGDDRGGSVDPTGTWGDTSDTTAPSLVLADGGGLTGTDGCNRLTGSWTVDESDHVEFHDVASTRMACEGVDTWLEGLSQATIADDTMTVIDQDGSEIGTLERQD
ncbi:META domain-containing protein [Agromyces sp. CF514]|uniref:META domain-containing protein n=1 Tax=Agromyces sp. CF514 TaxID=1881031 RepID=UPI0008F0BDFB|nr:META domain-containing protein [Agromyces sp. CF514]SFR68403.1 META domain-containing protein [Agromyces sp. CF514]